jgi:hypothetical protein
VTLDVLALAANVAGCDLAAIQAHAAEIAAEEVRDSGARFVGPALLYRLEHTAILHLLVAGLLLRHVEILEAQPIEIVSAGKRRRCAPVRRWHGRLRTLAFVTQRRRGRRTRLRVRCRCTCGQIVTVLKDDLVREKVRSCGCRRDELTAKRNRERALHRQRTSSIPTLPTWRLRSAHDRVATCALIPSLQARAAQEAT